MKLMPWIILHGQLRQILKHIQDQWEILLNGENAPEEKYHQYIADHAALMLCDGNHKLVSASKVRLGSDFAIDFAVTNDLRSYGFAYELIEIEVPYAAPFNKKGNPSERLVTAISQVQNWRLWIQSNPSEAQRLFPSKQSKLTGVPNITYTIIIGRRDNMENHLHLRNQFSSSLGIEIRSFDYLTDSLLARRAGIFPINASSEMDALTPEVRNALANPFAKALSDKEWRRLVKHPKFNLDHMIANNAQVLLDTFKYNLHYRKFLEEWEALGEEEKEMVNDIIRGWGLG